MSYAPGAPAAVWALDLDAGCKLTLMALWSKADHEDQRECRACTVWAPGVDGLTPAQALRSALAIQTCQTERAIRRHLSKLRTLGLADAQGRCVSLTAAWHSRPPTGTADHQRADHERARRDHQRAGADHERAPSDHERSLQLNPPVPPLPPNPVDDAHGREELTHENDDTHNHPHPGLGAGLNAGGPRRDDLARGRPAGHGRGEASGRGLDHRVDGGDGARRDGRRGPEDRHLGADSDVRSQALPAHVEASLARARGGAAPRRDHDLTQELWAVVIAGGFSPEAEHPMFRQALLETVRDKGMEPADLAQIFARYQLSSPMLRPDRSRLFYTRGKLGRKARDFLDRALDRDARPQSSTAYPMDGGLHVVGGAS